ncbi:MAG: glycosyltransferase family 1 protein [Myxococcales bacterium]|nr:glycosyltransferase family 1 protein [Myxococcales bacterium]
MKLAFFGLGSRGDVQPVLRLAARCRRAGHDAWVCASPDFAGLAQAYDVPLRVTGGSVVEMLSEASSKLTAGFFATVRTFNVILEQQIAAQFADSEEGVGDADAVFGGGLVLAAQSYAAKRAVPYLPVLYCPLLLRSAEQPPVVFPWLSLPRLANRALWASAGAFYSRILVEPVSRARAKLGLGPIDDGMRYVFGDAAVYAADREVAPVPSDVTSAVGAVGFQGPLGLESDDVLEDSLERFLRAGPPPVYVGFGSMTDADPARTTETIVEAARRAGRRLVLSRGWAKLGAHGRSDNDVHVIDDAPHGALFPRVAAVVHHAGAGTTHTAARAGVPQVAVPHLLDQAYWSSRVQALGLGPAPVPRSKLSVERLKTALVDATRPERTARARAFAANLPPPADSARALLDFVGALRARV